MKSPLEITYDQIQANHFICDENPLDGEVDMLGRILLWEGHYNPKDHKSPSFRVYRHVSTKQFIFQRYDKRVNEWVLVHELKARRFFRRKEDDGPAPGVVRIEMFLPNRTVRTVG